MYACNFWYTGGCKLHFVYEILFILWLWVHEALLFCYQQHFYMQRIICFSHLLKALMVKSRSSQWTRSSHYIAQFTRPYEPRTNSHLCWICFPFVNNFWYKVKFENSRQNNRFTITNVMIFFLKELCILDYIKSLFLSFMNRH